MASAFIRQERNASYLKSFQLHNEYVLNITIFKMPVFQEVSNTSSFENKKLEPNS
jgi:hypothetical protein